MFCTNCGKEVPSGANFCAACGTRIHVPKAVIPTAPPAPTTHLESISPALNTPKIPPVAPSKPELQMEPAGPAWPKWIWYLIVFALFNVAGRNLSAAIFGHGMLTATAGIGVGIAGAYGAAALLERVDRAGSRMLVGLGIVVTAFVLAIIGYITNDINQSAAQQDIAQATPKPHGPWEAYNPASQTSQTQAIDQPELKPFSGTLDAQQIPSQTNCIDYTSAAIPNQYTGARVTYNLQGVPIRTFLKLISEESNLNIVVSEKIDGNITTCAKNIPWDYALDTVLSANTLVRGNLNGAVYVYRP